MRRPSLVVPRDRGRHPSLTQVGASPQTRPPSRRARLGDAALVLLVATRAIGMPRTQSSTPGPSDDRNSCTVSAGQQLAALLLVGQSSHAASVTAPGGTGSSGTRRRAGRSQTRAATHRCATAPRGSCLLRRLTGGSATCLLPLRGRPQEACRMVARVAAIQLPRHPYVLEDSSRLTKVERGESDCPDTALSSTSFTVS